MLVVYLKLPVYDCKEEKKNYNTTIIITTVNTGHMFIYFNNL